MLIWNVEKLVSCNQIYINYNKNDLQFVSYKDDKPKIGNNRFV